MAGSSKQDLEASNGVEGISGSQSGVGEVNSINNDPKEHAEIVDDMDNKAQRGGGDVSFV